MSEIKKAVIFIGAVLFLGACILMLGEIYEIGIVIGIVGILLMIISPLCIYLKKSESHEQNPDEKDIDEK